jgi:hypothetical protein
MWLQAMAQAVAMSRCHRTAAAPPHTTHTCKHAAAYTRVTKCLQQQRLQQQQAATRVAAMELPHTCLLFQDG